MFGALKRNRISVAVLAAALIGCTIPAAGGFNIGPTTYYSRLSPRSVSPSSPTALQVWWFGGAESVEQNQNDESCELVAVRIDRTSPNSRKISGSITVPRPMVDVWAILTDYDQLATHVPNLVESRIVSKPSKGEQGDGSYQCKLFQKGAQKIVGFEFGASVTMAMTEKIIKAAAPPGAEEFTPQERAILFKCVDSFFFSEFDGEWGAKEKLSESGEVETELTYVVDVRPKGPVPVAALEWRIREDVPTNLRAVKKASVDVGAEGVLASRQGVSGTRRLASRSASSNKIKTPAATPPQTRTSSNTNAIRRAQRASPRVATNNNRKGASARNGGSAEKNPMPVAVAGRPTRNILQARRNGETKAASAPSKRTTLPFKVTWEADETMAAYLRE